MTTNKSFLIDALDKPDFINELATTGFIASNFQESELVEAPPTLETTAAGAALLHSLALQSAQNAAISVAPTLHGWTSASKLTSAYRFMIQENELGISVKTHTAYLYDVAVGEEAFTVELLSMDSGRAQLKLNGLRRTFLYFQPTCSNVAQELYISADGRDYRLQNLNATAKSSLDEASVGAVLAPMHGALIDIFVDVGQTVARGDRLAVLEAMKMQHELAADSDGEVTALHAKPGDQVAADQILMVIDAPETS